MVSSSFEPMHRDLGINLGLLAKFSNRSRFLAKSAKVELGLLPINNEAKGAYVLCTVGFHLYKVNRKKAK